MNELTSLEPTRRKIPFLPMAVVIVLVVAVSTELWLTNRPALEWWISPEIGRSGRHVRILVPRGWEVQLPLDSGRQTNGELITYYSINLLDRRPSFLRRIIPRGRVFGGMTINTIQSRAKRPDDDFKSNKVTGIAINDSGPGVSIWAERRVISRDALLVAEAYYGRSDRKAFDATYRQVLNSLKIE
jgi:hypothetical protein